MLQPGEEFSYSGIDGKTFKSVVKIEGNKSTAEILGNPRAVVITDFAPEKIVINYKTGNIQATQTFEA